MLEERRGDSVIVMTTSKSSFTNLEVSPNFIYYDLGDDKSKRYDFAAAFNLFDEDGQGTISEEELKHMLLKLQIITQANERYVCVCMCVCACVCVCVYIYVCVYVYVRCSEYKCTCCVMPLTTR